MWSRRLALALLVLAGFDWPGKLEAVAERLKDPDPKKRVEAIQDLGALDPLRATPRLLPLLGDAAQPVRSAAARVLARAGVEATVPVVTQWLTSPDKAQRAEAIQVLEILASPTAIPALARALGDPEAEIRRAAALALGKIGGERVVSPLVGRLDDDSSQVRRAAAEQLALLGDARAVVPLVERFGDASKDVRVAAIEAVGRLGDHRVVPALRRLLTDSLEDIPIAAVTALGHLRATAAVPDLIGLLAQRGDELRAKTAFALGQIHDPLAVSALVTALAHDALRPAAREALLLAGPAAVTPLIDCLVGRTDGDPEAAASILGALSDQRAVPALIAELLRGRVRLELLVEALRQLRDPRAQIPLLELLPTAPAPLRKKILVALEPIIDARAGQALLPLLSDADPELRVRTLRLAGRLRLVAAVPAVIATLEAERDEGLRAQAALALGRIGDHRASRPLLAVLAAGPRDLARRAAGALAELADPDTVTPLVALASDPRGTAREEALEALRGLVARERRDDVRRAVEALLGETRVPLLLAAVDVLAALRDPASVPALLELYAHAPGDVRRAVLDVFGDFGTRQAVPTLLTALVGEPPDGRAAAAWSLGKLADPTALPALGKAALSADLCTAVDATAALARRPEATLALDGRALLSHRSAFVRANAVLLVGRIAEPKDIDRVEQLAASDPSAHVRFAAVRALAGRAGETELIRRIAASDADARVRLAAASPGEAAGEEPLHIYWTDLPEAGGPVQHQRYVIVDPSGLVKCGVTDSRGESGEEQLGAGVPFYDLLDEAGEPVGTRTEP